MRSPECRTRSGRSLILPRAIWKPVRPPEPGRARHSARGGGAANGRTGAIRPAAEAQTSGRRRRHPIHQAATPRARRRPVPSGERRGSPGDPTGAADWRVARVASTATGGGGRIGHPARPASRATLGSGTTGGTGPATTVVRLAQRALSPGQVASDRPWRRARTEARAGRGSATPIEPRALGACCGARPWVRPCARRARGRR
jgi:hypothetical protein